MRHSCRQRTWRASARGGLRLQGRGQALADDAGAARTQVPAVQHKRAPQVLHRGLCACIDDARRRKDEGRVVVTRESLETCQQSQPFRQSLPTQVHHCRVSLALLALTPAAPAQASEKRTKVVKGEETKKQASPV
jgi:hypothetical protein